MDVLEQYTAWLRTLTMGKSVAVLYISALKHNRKLYMGERYSNMPKEYVRIAYELEINANGDVFVSNELLMPRNDDDRRRIGWSN